jgi:hypothetical protein
MRSHRLVAGAGLKLSVISERIKGVHEGRRALVRSVAVRGPGQLGHGESRTRAGSLTRLGPPTGDGAGTGDVIAVVVVDVERDAVENTAGREGGVEGVEFTLAPDAAAAEGKEYPETDGGEGEADDEEDSCYLAGF